MISPDKKQGGLMKHSDAPQILKKIRKTLDLTQEQLAQRLGVSFVSVNEWENGKRKPSPLAKAAIEQLLKETGIELHE
jgi:type I restriction enzyme M protein